LPSSLALRPSAQSTAHCVDSPTAGRCKRGKEHVDGAAKHDVLRQAQVGFTLCLSKQLINMQQAKRAANLSCV
jgi:hypothetical protein